MRKELEQRAAKLSPEKRRLLEQRLKGKVGARKRETQVVASAPAVATAASAAVDCETGPLSYAQQRLWFLDQMEEAAGTYHVVLAQRLRGPLDAAALDTALCRLVTRQSSLRTTFSEQAGEPRQVLQSAPHTLLTVEQHNVAVAARDQVIQNQLKRSYDEAFDLVNGPLFRARLLIFDVGDAALLLEMHHIITDGWSVSLLCRELDLYYCAALGRAVKLPAALPDSYLDYAIQQRSPQEEQRCKPHLDALCANLKGAPDTINLPYDFPRPAVLGSHGAVYFSVVNAATASALQRVFRKEQCSPYMGMLAAFSVLLHRLGGDNDMVIGTPVANRELHQHHDLIGLFVNTLALRLDLSERPDFRDLLKRTRTVVADGFAHAACPFEWVVDALQCKRHLDRAPLFQVMFSYQEDFFVGMRLGDLACSLVDVPYAAAMYDLSLNVEARGSELVCHFEYNTDLFSAETIAAIAQAFEVLLSHLPAAADAPIDLVPLVDQQLALLGVNSSVSSPCFVSPLFLIGEQAERNPWQTAMSTPDGNLSYGQLQQEINALASALVARGVAVEVLVGICMEPSAATVKVMLAVLQAGAAWLPLDLNFPPKRLTLMVQDALPALIVCDQVGYQRLLAAEIDPARLCLLEQLRKTSTPPLASPVVVDPDQAAYAMFTSGTTGRPKAAVVSQQALAAFSQAAAQTYGIASGDRILQFASFSFDAIIEEVFPCFTSGATLVLPGGELPASPLGFMAYCDAEAVTVLDLPTAFWSELVRALVAGEAHLPQALRLVIIGGEEVRKNTVKDWFAYVRERQQRTGFAAPQLINSYGPTEACVVATTQLVEQVDPVKPVPIGRPLAHVSAALLDARGLLVPQGLRGRLYLGGAALARGYLGQPALTAAVFVPNPFGGPGERMYDSGDVAVWLSDQQLGPSGACLGFIGRADQQVKIRGFRIEPAEVEQTLIALAEVDQVAVLVKDGVRLVAYLRLRDNAALQNVKELAAAQLPSFMLPESWVLLSDFPKTISGKIDTRALLNQTVAEPPAETTIQKPQTPLERQLCQLFAEVLKRPQIGPEDDFFDKGGHSLLAVRLMAKLRLMLGLGLRAFFKASTPTKLAAHLQATESSQVLTPFGEPTPTAVREQLSFAQQRLWLLDRLGAAAAYNVCEAYWLDGELNFLALAAALDQIVERHEVLRTVFNEVDGRPVAKVKAQVASVLRRETCAVDDLQHRLQQVVEAPFDLSRGPLLRAIVFELEAAVPGRCVFVWVKHHIVADAASTVVFLAEMARFYAAHCQGQTRQLAPLPLQYGDYAVWQRNRLTAAALEPALAFWRNQLDNLPKNLNLPYRAHACKQQRGLAGLVSFEIDCDVTRAIEALTGSRGSTMFLTLYAAFVLLLHRYTGACDIAVGTPVSDRNHEQLEPLIGFFVNTLVLRLDIAPEASFCDLLSRAINVFTSAHEHREIPFEYLVETLNPDRLVGDTPFFEVMFAFEGDIDGAFTLPGLRLTPYELAKSTAKFPLSLVAAKRGGQLVAAFEYDCALFHASTIHGMSRAFSRLLAAVAAAPHAPLTQLVHASNTPQAFQANEGFKPQQLTIMPLYRAAIRQHAALTAVQDGSRRLSFGELDVQVQFLAAELRRRGVGPEVTVGVCMERSCELLVAIWAILAAGGVYVPLDPDYPEHRLRYMAEDAGLTLLLTRAGTPAPQSLHGFPQLPFLVATADEHRAVADLALLEASPCQAAYMIYTSGSTGNPKGVMVDQAATAAYMQAVSDRIPMGPGDRLLQFSSPCFDASIMDFLAVPLAGATLVFRHPRAAESIACYIQQCREQQVTLLQMPPTYWRELIWELGQSGASIPASVRQIIVGGEAMAAADLNAWQALGSSLPQLTNVYGPTETIGFCTAANDSDLAASMPGIDPPIGHPNLGVTLSIMRDGQAVPAGVVGELFIGGPTVARGYHGLAALTAAHFVPDANAAEPGARCYRSGDLVCLGGDDEGTPLLWYRGRGDNQVKIRGYRIELGEIAAALNEMEGVRHAAVLCLERGGLGKQLAAAVVLTPSGELAQVRRSLPQRLPAYMVPDLVRCFADLPISPVGKIDYRALQDALQVGDAAADDDQTPSSPFESALAEVWREVLGCGKVGMAVSFFELGGHSLAAIRLAACIRSRFNIDCGIRDVFEQPSVRQLAALLQERQQTDDAANPAPVSLDQKPIEAQLSLAQKRLWFLDRYTGSGAAYHVAVAWRIEGALRLEALDRAFCKLLARQSALRTRFPTVAGEPRQVIGEVPATFLVTQNLEASALNQVLQQEIARSFDLEAGPLVRATLYQQGPGQAVLMLAAHHLVTDGWSLSVMQRELDLFYRGEDAQLAPLPLDYLEFSVQQTASMGQGRMETLRAYWRQQLADLPPLNLPLDKPRPATPSYRGARYDFALGEARQAALHQLAKGQSTSLFSLLYTLFALLLSKYADSRDVALGIPFAGRDQHNLEHLVGFFVNTLVIRLDLSGDPRFLDLLTRSRDLILAALAHGDIPFDAVVEAVAPTRDPAVSPLFQVMFSYQGEQAESSQLGDLTLTPVDLGCDTAQFDLTLTLFEAQRAGLMASFEYSTDLFTATSIANMSAHFTALLDAVLASPTAQLSALSPISCGERKLLLGNSPNRKPSSLLLHEMVFQAAADQLDQVAVMQGEQRLSYRALLEQAQRLATVLRQSGVGSDTMVGVYLADEVARVPALLDILAAGGAFVPLDPENPHERLAYQIRDADLRVIVGRDLPAQLSALVDELAIPVLDPKTSIAQTDSELTPVASVFAEHLAYVIYTSGSSGRPKGTEIPHAAVVNYIQAARYRFATRRGDRLLRFTGIGFDVTVEDVFVTLAAGGTLVGRASDDLEIEHFLSHCREQQITILSLPTSYWRELSDALVLNHWQLPPAVRLIVIGGEALAPCDLGRWRQHIGDRVCLINAYGPTETTISATMAKVAGPGSYGSEASSERREVPIGEAFADATLHIVDTIGDLQPTGIPGELFIGGKGLARGYLGNPRLTAERFVPNPFSQQQGERLYRSGDRVRRIAQIAADGTGASYCFLSRMDRQCKLRGFRIELGEIEAALQAIAGVAHALVLLRSRAGTEAGLEAHWVAKPGVQLEAQALLAVLRERLPTYMVPRVIREWPTFPMLNGKIDRTRIAASVAATGATGMNGAAEAKVVMPRSMLEFQLLEIWQALLPKQPLGVTDDFFEAGGHSLLAVRLMTRIRQKWDKQWGLDRFFRDPTIAGCAALLLQDESHEPFSHLVPIKREGQGEPLFCIHPDGGQVLCYVALARSLQSTRPVYGLQALGPEIGTAIDNIATMAETYWRVIADQQPHGPLFLMGWSFGGVVAQEIARLAVSKGREVAFLGLLDSEAPDAAAKVADDVTLLARLIGIEDPQTLKHMRSLTAEQRAAWVVALGREAEMFPADFDSERLLRLIETVQIHSRAWQSFKPAPIAGRIDFFKAADPDGDDRSFRPTDPEKAWQALAAKGLALHSVTGSHKSMMQPPQVQKLAECLDQILAKIAANRTMVD